MTRKQEVLATMLGGMLGGLAVALSKPRRTLSEPLFVRYEVVEADTSKVSALQTERALLELRLAGLSEETFSGRLERMQLESQIRDLDRQIRRELR